MYNEGFIIVDINITPPMSCVHGSHNIFENKASGCENLVYYVKFEGRAVDHGSLAKVMFRIRGEWSVFLFSKSFVEEFSHPGKTVLVSIRFKMTSA